MSILNKLAPCFVATLLLFPLGASAAECKGMSKSKCEKASQCTYVKGYTTKSGSKVQAYCRNKSKSSSKSSSSKSK